jgi:hypothetical protein
MKIKVKKMDYDEVLKQPSSKKLPPRRPSILFRTLLKLLSSSDLKATNFTYTQTGMERWGKNEPALILMNHSSFIDLKIASTVLYPRSFNIVCTSDGFVGKEWLMRRIGCIPTNKFVTDAQLVRDILYALKTNNCSVLMYPEASYSFDGTATPLPESLGKCLKLLGVPVIMIRTYGAFSRDPLYNGLRLRNVDVSCNMEYVLSPEDIDNMTVDELNHKLSELFTFDNFDWQIENKVRISEPTRAEGLNRVLYKCPECLSEGSMAAKGTKISCKKCGCEYELSEYGEIIRTNGKARFSTVPKWYRWERECVKDEILYNNYKLDVPVEILMMVNTDCIYDVGEGRLVHDENGFKLTGCDGRLDYSQKPTASYSLYSDYFWYEIGDMICIGNKKVLYYCFPKCEGDIVAKTRLAAEEMYKLARTKSVSRIK